MLPIFFERRQSRDEKTDMNEFGIYVFSGTGNTLKCAKTLRDALERKGVFGDFYELKVGETYFGEKNLVLCYPVHGFNAPNVMLRFCREMPSGSGCVWFMKTSGEPLALNGNSSGELIRILRKKGYHIKGEFHYVMPYNMVFRHSDELASLMWKTAQERIPQAAKQIANGNENRIKPSISAKAISLLCRIEHWFYPKNGRLYHADMNRCTKCMRCVKDCPTGNISFSEGRFHFGGACSGCARCSFQCPVEAIHIGLLDFMRVNGPYDFTGDFGKASIGRYCKKAYQRYFHS